MKATRVKPFVDKYVHVCVHVDGWVKGWEALNYISLIPLV